MSDLIILYFNKKFLNVNNFVKYFIIKNFPLNFVNLFAKTSFW